MQPPSDKRIRIRKVRDFSRDYDFAAFAIIRVRNPHVENLGGRHGWVKIRSGEHVIYRRVRGGGPSLGLTNDSAEMDYDSRRALGIKNEADDNHFYSCDVEVLPTTPLERVVAHWNHPDPGYRAAFQLAILGMGLGGISLIIAIIGLFLGIVGLGLGVTSAR